MQRRRSHEEPFGWWGPVWETPTPRTLPHLVRQGVMTAEVAALLAELVARRASIVVAAGPSGAGKTTLLTALLDELPKSTNRVYIRGCYEPFDFLQTTDPLRTALLINEISGHFPFYLWGPGVRRVLSAARSGYQLAATAHASTVEEFVYGLTGYPLRIPAEELKAIDLLVLLDAWRTSDGVRRVVRSVVSLSTPGEHEQIVPVTLAAWQDQADHAVADLLAAIDLNHRLSGSREDIAQAVLRRATDLARNS